MRPEAELLLCCARTCVGSETAERIRALLQQKVDWTYLYRLAVLYGMMPFLYWHLNSTCPEAIPKASLDYLRDYFRANAAHNLYLTAELCTLLKLLDANGIPAIPFRGPALAASVYGDLTLRQISDLDILVRKRDVTKARDLLDSRGYRPLFSRTRAKEAGFLEIHSKYHFLHSRGRVVMQPHLRILSLRPDTEPLWERLEPLSLGGDEVLTLSPEDSLLILCVNGVKHLWERHPWICDVAILAGLHKRMDWGRVLEQARALGSGRILFLALNLAGDLLGAELPGEVLQRVEGDTVVTTLAAQVRERLVLETSDPPGVLECFLFQLKARDHLKDKIRYCLMAMTPSHGDWKLLPLPPCLSFLYYLLRPIRLLHEYGRELFQHPVLDLARFVGTPLDVIDRMLALAEVGPTHVVYDLGCGDGRIVIMAAKRYGARGVGVDIDPRRIAKAKSKAREEGVEHLVRFIQQDAKTVDVSEATVVTLSLTGPGNLRLRQILQAQLRPGTCIVSRDFDMADWPPEKTEVVEGASGAPGTLYLWRVAEPRNHTSDGTFR